jgi:ABC-type multidrug transport system ATPase subunit
MIGNSKIVMLDEPTSGMDTTARRKLWEMLKKNKAGRIVILTTHYMDEADILGDRIAIMAEGDVQCTGSSLFLKYRYGVGYNLVIAKMDRVNAPQVDNFIN